MIGYNTETKQKSYDAATIFLGFVMIQVLKDLFPLEQLKMKGNSTRIGAILIISNSIETLKIYKQSNTPYTTSEVIQV